MLNKYLFLFFHVLSVFSMEQIMLVMRPETCSTFTYEVLILKANDICSEISDPIVALNTVEKELAISDSTVFFKLLAVDSFKNHVITLLHRMQAFFNFANAPADNLGLILAQKICLNNLLPHSRNFIISRFNAHCSWDIPESITNEIQTPPTKQNKARKPYVAREQDGKVYTVYDVDAQRHCTLEFSELQKNVEEFDMRTSKVKVPASGKPIVIVFLQESYWQHIFAFSIDLDNFTSHRFYHKAQTVEYKYPWFQYRDAGFSSDDTMFFLITSQELTVFKIKPRFDILVQLEGNIRYALFSCDNFSLFIAYPIKGNSNAISVWDLTARKFSADIFLRAHVHFKMQSLNDDFVIKYFLPGSNTQVCFKKNNNIEQAFWIHNINVHRLQLHLRHQKKSISLLSWFRGTSRKDTILARIESFRSIISKFVTRNRSVPKKPSPETPATEYSTDPTVFQGGLGDTHYYTGLAIDGDAFQSISSACLLAKIEEETGSRIADLFDMVTGSSFGAVVALGVVGSWDEQNPLMPPLKYYDLLYNNAHDIFGTPRASPPYYEQKNLLRVLSSYYRNTLLSNSLTRFMLPCLETTKYSSGDIVTPFVIDSHMAQRDLKFDAPLVKVASYAIAQLPYYASGIEDSERKVKIGPSVLFQDNSSEFLYDHMTKNKEAFDRHKIMVLTLATAKKSEAHSIIFETNARTHNKLKETLGSNYARIELLNQTATSVCSIDDCKDDVDAAYKGWESFFRRLQENKAAKHALALVEN